jgi:hypothetical protein
MLANGPGSSRGDAHNASNLFRTLHIDATTMMLTFLAD